MSNISFSLPTAASNTYPNAEAHKEVKNMMARKERIVIKPYVDHYGCLSVWVESPNTKGFCYQLSHGAMQWLIDYLTKGAADDMDVTPTAPLNSEGHDNNTLRKELIKELVNAKLGTFQTVPVFRDRPGMLTTTANFKHGTIAFYIDRDEEIEDFMRERNLIS